MDDSAKQGKSIGFVPTMGALHQGHLSLVRASKDKCDITLCSIFINPVQFNDKKDLERYPRTPEKDLEALRNAKCDALFMPTVEEMYPENHQIRIPVLGEIGTILEGKFRPGHFEGVAKVISRLFELIQPNFAFFGMKDLQQVRVIEKVRQELHFNTAIVPCPTLREEDGLAMSSRNALLSAEERNAASLLPRLLHRAREMYRQGCTPEELSEHVLNALSSSPIYRPEYFAVCRLDDLTEVSAFEKDKSYVILIACFVGKIRLIDNLILSK